MADKIDRKYYVIKFVPDLLRDEPVNVGVICQDINNSIYIKSILEDEQWALRNESDQSIDFLKGLLLRLTKEVKENNVTVENIFSRYSGKLRFQEIHQLTSDDNLLESLNSYYNIYVEI